MKCARTLAIRIAILITLAAAPGLAETSITTCPFRITQPGNYVLGADLVCTGDNSITIRASNVSLKLNGHKITPPRGTLGGGIVVDGSDNIVGPLDHVGIQGPGLIIGNGSLSVGIYLWNASYSQVSGVSIVGASTAGILAQFCDFLTLASNVIGQSGAGVATNRTNSTTLTGNDMSGNTDGISFFGGSGNNLTNNIANGNSNSGIISFGSGMRLSGNVTNGNGQYGIDNRSTILQAFSNTSKGNGIFDLNGAGSCNGTWSDNVFLTASDPCIH